MSVTGAIHFTIVDGRRQPISPDVEVLFRLLNGAFTIPAKWAKGGDIRVSQIPFQDTDHDSYNVFAHPSGCNATETPQSITDRRPR